MSDDFIIGENKIECVKFYKYLWLIFSNTGKFCTARKTMWQGIKIIIQNI